VGWFGSGASVRSALATGLERAAEDIRRERRAEFFRAKFGKVSRSAASATRTCSRSSWTRMIGTLKAG